MAGKKPSTWLASWRLDSRRCLRSWQAGTQARSADQTSRRPDLRIAASRIGRPQPLPEVFAPGGRQRWMAARILEQRLIRGICGVQRDHVRDRQAPFVTREQFDGIPGAHLALPLDGEIEPAAAA